MLQSAEELPRSDYVPKKIFISKGTSLMLEKGTLSSGQTVLELESRIFESLFQRRPRKAP